MIESIMKRIFIPGYLFVLALITFPACGQNQPSPWLQMDSILLQIREPSFTKIDYLLTDFGARGDATTDCSDAFAKAIEKCSGNGGGRVIVPKGVFLTGPIHLLSNT